MGVGRILQRIATVRRMTNEERITGLEDAVRNLGRIEELRHGFYASNISDPRVIAEGEQVHQWERSVQEHRAGT